MEHGPASGAPSRDEVRLVAVLVTGATVERAAEHLGWSRSTLRRRLHAVMAKLSARSRFQAGYRLAEAGWLGGVGHSAQQCPAGSLAACAEHSATGVVVDQAVLAPAPDSLPGRSP